MSILFQELWTLLFEIFHQTKRRFLKSNVVKDSFLMIHRSLIDR